VFLRLPRDFSTRNVHYTEVKRQEQPQKKPHGQQEEVVLDAANSDAAQIVTGEETTSASESASSTNVTNISIHQFTEGIVNSDEQTILNATQQTK